MNQSMKNIKINKKKKTQQKEIRKNFKMRNWKTQQHQKDKKIFELIKFEN